MAFDIETTREEIRHWFFDVYFNHWVDVGAGRRKDPPEFILDYWGTPLYANVDEPDITVWMLTGEEIVGFLQMQHETLKANGYDHTEVPDQKVIVYNRNGGAIEVIWSRQAADNTEIQRFVVHFEVVRFDGVWKVVGMQVRQSDVAKDQGSIHKAWTQ
jgi:hypothetical protein